MHPEKTIMLTLGPGDSKAIAAALPTLPPVLAKLMRRVLEAPAFDEPCVAVVLGHVADHFHTSIPAMLKAGRNSNVIFCRHLAIYLLHQLTGRGDPALLRYGVTRSTFNYSLIAAKDRLCVDPAFKAQYDLLHEQLVERLNSLLQFA